MDSETFLALGLMSGTSLDGIDAALVVTDGEGHVQCGKTLAMEYPHEIRGLIRDLMARQNISEMMRVERELTLLHAEAVEKLCTSAGYAAREIDVIGFHGQTLLHLPDESLTLQIGDGALLAHETGISTINDFRRADMANGGQGAPLVPIFHQALAQELPKPLAVLNIGGVGNVTYIGPDNELLAFDTGPGNALINDFVREHAGAEFDRDGEIASSGKADMGIVEKLLDDPFFAKIPPKSLDRDHFSQKAKDAVSGLHLADAVATLTAFTAASILSASDHFPDQPKQWIMCGGGRHNKALAKTLKHASNADIVDCKDHGWNGDMLEAQAFAYLAVRTLKGLPLTFPGTTGCGSPTVGGSLSAN